MSLSHNDSLRKQLLVGEKRREAHA